LVGGKQLSGVRSPVAPLNAATARAHPSVFVGAVAYVPVALVAGYASWNYWVAILLVIALSYGLCSRRVIVGLDFLAILKFGPYRRGFGRQHHFRRVAAATARFGAQAVHR
jgi:hypothetical protein